MNTSNEFNLKSKIVKFYKKKSTGSEEITDIEWKLQVCTNYTTACTLTFRRQNYFFKF